MQSADVPSLDLDRDEGRLGRSCGILLIACVFKFKLDLLVTLVTFAAIPSRGHVLHVTFPKAWKTVDLINLFQSFGNSFSKSVEMTFVTILSPENNTDQSMVVLSVQF